MSKSPTQKQYEDALEVVQKYEKRQADLKKLNKDLGYHLQQFENIKFDVNEDKKEVTFAGTTKDGRLKLTRSVAKGLDIFNDTIGKLTCVLKALEKDIEYVQEYVESKSELIIGGHMKGVTLRDLPNDVVRSYITY